MKLPRNEKGITLVELLAVLAILGIIFVFITNIYLYTQKQFDVQSEDAIQLTDISIAMREITEHIRKEDIEEITNNKIQFKNNNYYELVNDTLIKNGSPYMYQIEQFEVAEINEDEISIMIQSQSGKKIETTLIVR